MITLANPLGLWALLGIPAVIAIHFLQRKSIVLPVSTLFLLEKTQRESASGRRFDRLMNSIPLWMQLLAVLLLAWLLSEPRYQKPRSTQRVAIVLDSSASMSVFKERAIETLRAKLPPLQGPAAILELTVFESVPGRPKLFTGTSLEDLSEALQHWNPRDGLTDPNSALQLARSLVSREGIVLYVTDTPPTSLPYDAATLAVGEAIENVGFTGVSYALEGDTLIWRAIVRNYGTQPADRTWHLESPGGRSSDQPIRLDPGSIAALQAAFPAGTDQARVVLSSDRFEKDNSLPLLRPASKPLTLYAPSDEDFAALSRRLVRAIDSMTPVNDTASADLAFLRYDPLDPQLPLGNAIVFVRDDTQGGAYLKGGILAEKHPLIDGLNWQTLLVRETISLERTRQDQVILWQEQRPLIFLRDLPAKDGKPAARQLFFNFDLKRSNAATQPGFIVLLHRFAESIRESKVAPARISLETTEPIQLATHPGKDHAPPEPLTLTLNDLTGKEVQNTTLPLPLTAPLEAPLDPGFLTIRQGKETLLTASVHFGDTREADFSACASSDDTTQHTGQSVERHTVEDPWWRVVTLLLVAALLVSWHYVTSGKATSAAEPSTISL